MNNTMEFNWKSIAALGLSAIGLIAVEKMSPEQIKEVLISLINAFKGVSFGKETH